MSVRREIQKSHEALLNTIAQLAAERVDNYFFQLVRSDFITESDQVQTFGRVKSENPDDRRLELVGNVLRVDNNALLSSLLLLSHT